MNKTEQLAIKMTQIYFDSLPRSHDVDSRRADKIIETYNGFLGKLSGN